MKARRNAWQWRSLPFYKGNLERKPKRWYYNYTRERKVVGLLNGNQIDKLAELIAFLKADYMFSGEAEKIQNAKRNDEKYELLCETWEACYELANNFKGKLDGTNPDFPCGCHLIRLVLPTEDDEIVLREIKSQLADAIDNCDEVNIDTDLKGNLRIHFGFENVYTE